jgi:CBS domain-containing protein
LWCGPLVCTGRQDAGDTIIKIKNYGGEDRMNVFHGLTQDTVSELESHPVLKIEPSKTVREALEILQETGRGCVLVCEGDELQGIFTERDVLMRVYGEKQNLDQPVTNLMTSHPTTIRSDESIASVVKKMRNGGYRHIPVVDHGGRPVSIVSVKHIVQYFVDHYPEAVYNLPPDPDAMSSSREGA